MHCKDVSVHEVDSELTAENISRLMADWTSYIRTEVLILRNGDDFASVLIRRTDGTGLFRSVKDHEILSLPGDTVYMDDPETDVINIPAMARIQSENPGKTVIVKGMFSHVNIIKDIAWQRLTVVDNVPPEPQKLGVLVKTALASGFVGHPVVAEEVTIDMADRVSEVDTEAVMFPCRVSGLTADIPVYFLDGHPELKHEVTLIGCHLSKRIFTELYRRDVKFINVCPADFAGDGKTIVKCCKIKEGHIIDGNTAKVPWGATVPEVAGALNALFSE
jgi:hypothetical protein